MQRISLRLRSLALKKAGKSEANSVTLKAIVEPDPICYIAPQKQISDKKLK